MFKFLLEYMVHAMTAVLCAATFFAIILASTQGVYLYLGITAVGWILLYLFYSKLDRAIDAWHEKK